MEAKSASEKETKRGKHSINNVGGSAPPVTDQVTQPNCIKSKPSIAEGLRQPSENYGAKGTIQCSDVRKKFRKTLKSELTQSQPCGLRLFLMP